MLRSLLRGLWKLALWLVAGLVLVEVLCFLIVIFSTYYLYGQFHEGEPVQYDAYALYRTGTGERPTHYNAPPSGPERVKRLWMFGGSTMRGVTDFDERTIPSVVARLLNQEEPRVPAVAANFGADGYNSLLETRCLQKLLIERPDRPDVIIFYDGANDCTYFAQYRTPDAHHGYRQVRALVESYHQSFFGLLKPLNAALYASYIRDFYDKVREGVIPIAADAPVLREFAASALRRYDYVNKVAACYGARFLLIWQPMWWVETGEVAADVKKQEKDYMIIGKYFSLEHNFQVTYRALVEGLKDKPYFVDFRNVLCSRTGRAYQSDGIHLEDLGREMVAREMARVLKKDLLPPGTQREN